MLDRLLISIQCFLLYAWAYSLAIAPIINGSIEKIYAKYNKKVISVIGLLFSFSFFFGGLFLITRSDKENNIFWYLITLGTVLSSIIVFLNIETTAKQINNPSTWNDYICNARYEIVKGNFMRFSKKWRFVIYLLYIVIMVFNQIGTLDEYFFSNSLYLQVNEYSLIILFATDEMIKQFRKRKLVQ